MDIVRSLRALHAHLGDCRTCDDLDRKTIGEAAAEIDHLRQVIAQMHGMARKGCESPNAAYRWCERIDEVGFYGPIESYSRYKFTPEMTDDE